GRFEFGNGLTCVELPVDSPAAVGCGRLFGPIAVDHRQTVVEEVDWRGVDGQAGGPARGIGVLARERALPWIKRTVPTGIVVIACLIVEPVDEQVEDVIALSRLAGVGDNLLEVLTF